MRKEQAIGFAFGAIVVLLLGFAYWKMMPPEAQPGAAAVVLPQTAGATSGTGDIAAQPGAAAPNPHAFPAERMAPAGPPLLSGTLNVDPSISLSPGARVTVFVIARTTKGKATTVLARRIDVDAFPVPFSLSSADSMMAGQKPEDVSLEARIDLDGDAMTHEPGSAKAVLPRVKMGSKGIELTLKPEM